MSLTIVATPVKIVLAMAKNGDSKEVRIEEGPSREEIIRSLFDPRINGVAVTFKLVDSILGSVSISTWINSAKKNHQEDATLPTQWTYSGQLMDGQGKLRNFEVKVTQTHKTTSPNFTDAIMKIGPPIEKKKQN
jgi:hypothetical protein